MRIEYGVDLQGLCTMATPAIAERLVRLTDAQVLPDILAQARANNWPIYVLGGGSNVVMSGDLPGLVIQVALKGISTRTTQTGALVTAAAGESWQALVDYSVRAGWWGLENLNLIPGTVGAAPIQNIGAYGVELESLFDSLTAVRVSDGERCTFDRAACEFSYRHSRFKREGERYIILDVTLQVNREPSPVLSYPGLRDALAEAPRLTPAAIASAVAALRRAKLPDPRQLPNSGSFFHNPVVSASQAEALQAQYPALVSYPLPDGHVKLAAGWLIEQAGLKGLECDGVGVHKHQALVLVNPGKRSGQAVLALAHRVAQGVFDKFGVRLNIEPQILP